nr:reverse transcriptase domain-containing protein [Tanacetum cinerariifolium]
MAELLRAPTEGYAEAIVDRFKDLLGACPYHGFTELHQLDTFYNGLNPFDQDSLNSATSGNLLERSTQDALKIIENKSRVRNSRNNPIVSQVKASNVDSSEMAKLTDAVTLHQLDTFYNGLNPFDQDSLNSATGGNLLERSTQDALKIIENKSRVQNSRNNPIVSQVKASNVDSSEMAKLTDAVTQVTSVVATMMKQIQTPTPAFVKAVEESCVTCGGAHSYRQCPATNGNTFTGYHDNIQGYVSAAASMFGQFMKMNTASSSGLGSLPSNTVPNPQEDLKAITTQSGVTLVGPLVSPPPSPSNENCSAVILKKLPEKLKDTGRFLIPCEFHGLDSCMALADLEASINLMPLSMWKTISLLELSTTRMALELATRTVAIPAGIVEDVFVQVGKFTFPADFVVVDYEVDPRVPLILGRPFLRTAHALVDVHGEKLTLQISDEELVFNVEIASKYPQKHSDKSIHKIDILNTTCEDHFHE